MNKNSSKLLSKIKDNTLDLLNRIEIEVKV